MTDPQKADFDVHADNYDGGMGNPLKALAGGRADDFIWVKVHWLLRNWPDLQVDPGLSILDYGCGVGTLPRLLRSAGVPGHLTGTDISGGMLEEAERIWPACFARPTFRRQIDGDTGLPSGSFDVVIISAVLHHIAVGSRGLVYEELHRLLRPTGRLVVFEHNPLNPITRFVVSRTPIDHDAVLLRATEVTEALNHGGWRDIRTSNLMFLPPRLGPVATIADRMLERLPMGGQYAVTARK
jgi:SAM-dependent methyltransferase